MIEKSQVKRGVFERRQSTINRRSGHKTDLLEETQVMGNTEGNNLMTTIKDEDVDERQNQWEQIAKNSQRASQIENLYDAILRQRICKLVPRIEPHCQTCPLNKAFMLEPDWSWCRILSEMHDRIQAGIFRVTERDQLEISKFLREGMTQ